MSEGRVIVEKVRGDENPADLMTKILNINIEEIEERLNNMSLDFHKRAELEQRK